MDNTKYNILYNNVINRVYPNLNGTDKNFLNIKYKQLIDFITTILPNSEEYIFKILTRYDFRDSISLLNLLLPYINDFKKDQIKSFDDMYIHKEKDNIYTYTNLQYNRCNRLNIENPTEIHYMEDFFMDNYRLLLISIHTMINKMYINWTDTFPHSLESYKTSNLYKITKNKYETKNINNFDPENNSKIEDYNLSKLGGLSSGEIYNVIHNDLYMSIKDYKRFIYDVKNTTTGTYTPLLIVFNNIINLDKILENTEWEDLKEFEKNLFITQLNDFINTALNKVNNKKYNDYVLSEYEITKIVQDIIIYFDNFFGPLKNKHKNGDFSYIPLHILYGKLKRDEDDDFEINSNLEIKIRTTLESIKVIKPEYFYEFLSLSIQKIKNTWYGIQLLDDNNKFKSNKHNKILGNEATLKNIYNYAKNFSLFNENNTKKNKTYQELDFIPDWNSLDINKKKIIENRINRASDFYNIRGILKQKYGIDNQELEKINKKIKEDIEIKLIDYIFEAMVIRGVLTQFIDKENKTISEVVTKNNLEQSYYYLSCEKYITSNIDFFSNLDTQNWYTQFAMNWVSQLNFYHHYMNNRVLFITGATGVGKSTQIPKLFAYALKAIDHKDTGKVICTEPRTMPTEGNAIRVAGELGLPIDNKDKTKNFYNVQFKHKQRNHISRISKLIIKFITDGTFILELQNNPLGKKKERDDTKKKESNHSLENIGDIIIVDEAHEHNRAMESILTFMNYTTYYNNSIKLVILSATIDNDEPAYRRFYRNINDNLQYPLNMYIAENMIDRINVDRRIHISAPYQTTKYKVDEYYVPHSNEIELVKQIMNTSSDGHILIFEPGVGQINKLVEQINTITPGNVIALSFHSKLKTEQREFMNHLNKNLSSLKISKNESFDYSDNLYKGNANYTRAIIVATNIAEASITIENLKFVIDTGKQNKLKFNYKNRESSLIEGPIDESSRLQRKGRVGRSSDGIVYYLYEEEYTKSGKSEVAFTSEDIQFILYDFLKTGNDEKKLIEDNFTSINASIQEIIQKQYNILEIKYNYIGNSKYYDYDHNQPPNAYYETGFDMETLEDKKGTFYTIHPDELLLKRNIVGIVIDVEDLNEINYNKTSKEIGSYKLKSFFNDLIDRRFIKNNNKTDYGNYVLDISTNFELEIKSIDFSVSYLYSLMYNCEENIIRIISIYQATNGDIKNFVKFGLIDGKYQFSISKLKKIFKKYSSDTDIILRILDIFHTNIFKEQEYTDINVNKDDDEKQKKIYYAIDDEQTKEKIILLSKKLYISETIIFQYYKIYHKIKHQIHNKVKKNNFNTEYIKTLHHKYQEIIKRINCVTLSLIHGFCFNICKKIEKNKYISLISQNTTGVYNISELNKKTKELKMFVSKTKIQNYILCLTLDLVNNEISWIHNIPIIMLSKISYIYNTRRINENYNMKLEQKYNYNVPKYISIKQQIKNDLNNFIK
jgi:hypothetical protein